MKVYYDLAQLPTFEAPVLTIGSFDGVHTGHQAIFAQLQTLKLQWHTQSVVLTFHPHPRAVLQSDTFQGHLLTTIDEKIFRLREMGVDHLVIIPFTAAFAQLSPEAYIAQFLVHYFRPRAIIIGYDHRFGAHRAGNLTLLQTYSTHFGYEVIEIPKQQLEDVAISSTKIRSALQQGDIATANKLLGYAYCLQGTVVKGDQLGRSIGYPTANLALQDSEKLIPAIGIYAARAHVQGQWHDGMLYIGRRPVVEDNSLRIEINLFDFEKAIYGESLRICLQGHIRADAHFADLAALQQQLAADKIAAQQLLATDSSAHNNAKQLSMAVVILNYNGIRHLQTFLPSVVAHSKEAALYLADNASTDESIKWVRETYPQIRVIALPQNYGFAGGYNEALREVREDLYVLLNSDVAVTADWLRPIRLMFAQQPTLGAVQPKILAYRQPTHFEYAGAAGGMMDYLGYSFCRGRLLNETEADTQQYEDSVPIFWASGAALFMRKELFTGLGGFDADYFAHWEEIDLCWRVQAAGYTVQYCPASVVYHLGGGTLGYDNPRKTYLNFRNTLFTLFKNESWHRLWWLLPVRLTLDGLAGVFFLLQGKWRLLLPIVKAHFAFYAALPALWRKRRLYQQKIAHLYIGAPTQRLYPRSLLWAYHFHNKKTYTALRHD